VYNLSYRVATGQEMVRENQNSSRSEKSQKIVFRVRENCYFEEKPGKSKFSQGKVREF